MTKQLFQSQTSSAYDTKPTPLCTIIYCMYFSKDPDVYCCCCCCCCCCYCVWLLLSLLRCVTCLLLVALLLRTCCSSIRIESIRLIVRPGYFGHVHLFEFHQHRIEFRQGTGQVRFLLGPGDDDFSGHKHQKHHPWTDQPVDQARKQFRLVRGKPAVRVHQTLQAYRKPAIGRPDNVLDLEIHQLLRLETDALDDVVELFAGQRGVVRGLDARDAYLAGGKNQGRGPGFPQPHDDGAEPPRVELGVAALEGDLFQVQPDAEIGRRGNVLYPDQERVGPVPGDPAVRGLDDGSRQARGV
mmetsp:Transcript_24452/g.53555  ORF Transcript_24452/g.53555 Transcript_24452/m.53555 type:complete len:298 (+) Transcript_24452:193-1086(+)